MLIQWKRRQTKSTLAGHADPSDVQELLGVVEDNAALSYPQDAHLARMLGLVPIPASSLAIKSICDLLRQHGPLWTGGQEHAFVVVGANERLDQVFIHDPSPMGTGRAIWQSWTRWYVNGIYASSVGDHPMFDIQFMYHP